MSTKDLTKDEKAVLTISKNRVGRASREDLIKQFRNPITLHNLFGYKDDENFRYRVVHINSQEGHGKIERFQRMGYEIHDTVEVKGDLAAKSGTPTVKGSAHITTTSKGEQFVIMRIPQELARENDALKDIAFEKQLQFDSKEKTKISNRKDGDIGDSKIAIDGGIAE
jgi:hypothetical protein